MSTEDARLLTKHRKFDVAAFWDGLSSDEKRAVGCGAIVATAGRIGVEQGFAPRVGFVAAEIEGLHEVQAVLEMTVAWWLGGPILPELSSIGVNSCRRCGCTDAVACDDICCWAEPDLCTTCAGIARAPS